MTGSAEQTKVHRLLGTKTISNLERCQQGPMCSPGSDVIGRVNSIVAISVSFEVQRLELFIQRLSNSWRISKVLKQKTKYLEPGAPSRNHCLSGDT